MPLKRSLVSALLISVAAPAPAFAEDVPEAGSCELASAIGALGRLAATSGPAPAGATLRLHATPTAVTVSAAGSEAPPLLTIACDGVSVTGGGARFTRGAGWSVTRGRHATSLELAPGALFPEAVHVLVLDDGGLSVSLGDARAATDRARPAVNLYARELRASGELVEREAARVGCGCERVTEPDGRRVERPLTAPAPR
jgi:hypothetical protein